MQKTIVLLAAVIGLATATHLIHAVRPAQSGVPKVIEISAKKYEFTPNEIHVLKGERVELKVHSEDATHGVKLDAYAEGAKDKTTPGLLFDKPDENGRVKKGEDQLVDFVAQQAGTYDFKCAKFCGFGHDRMKGKLVVDSE